MTATKTSNSTKAATNTTLDRIEKQILKLTDRDKLELFRKLGVGNEESDGLYYTCQRCGKILPKASFYVSTETGQNSQITHICKKCAKLVACPIIDGEESAPTKETVDYAMYLLNKPMLDTLWESSLYEAANTTTGRTKNNVYTAYCKNVQMTQYNGLTYQQSDNYTGGLYTVEALKENALPKDKEILDQFEKNKKDILRLIGYSPFEKEKLCDQPFLYSQLVGFLDSGEDSNDDMMRISSIISIVRGFLQLSQIDDRIAEIMQDPKNFDKNVANYKALQEMKKNITVTITKLAEQSCISLKHSKTASKGESTWTYKVKKIKDLNLREGEVNGFDLETCKAMRQVMDLSNASIMKQLALDESEYSDMIAEQREMITKLQSDLAKYTEISRILLRENLDLKDLLKENDINIDINLVNLNDLYSVFSKKKEIEEVVIDEKDGVITDEE